MATARFVRATNDVENLSTTLNGAITNSATTITVNDASNIVTPCYLVIDRVDSAGTLKATSSWEYVLATAKASNDLTVTRGLGGSTNQAHSNGAVVEAVITAEAWEDQRAALIAEHDSAGAHVLSNPTIIRFVIPSIASIARAEISNLIVGSVMNTSAASVIAPPSTFGWQIKNLGSIATVAVGSTIRMPRAGNLQFLTVTYSRGMAVSGTSLILDINKDGTSIFDAGTRIMMLPSGGTFISTASIKTKNFVQGSEYDLDVDQVGLPADFTVQGYFS